jgi:hypothetical protein
MAVSSSARPSGAWIERPGGASVMLLNVNDDRFFENPDQAAVVEAVETLERDQFAILSRADEDYVQAYHNEDGTFELQFRAGSYDRHYRATSESLRVHDIVEAFLAFMSARPEWYLTKILKAI